MPQALPMVAAWAAAAWTSAVTATAGALASVGVVAAIGEGATIALAGGILKTAALTAVSAAASVMMRPNTPSSGTTLDFKPDPKAPVRGAMGFTAVGGNKVFQATWGYKRVAMSLGVALSLGPIQSVAAFQADGSTVAFNPANQYEALGFYDADMWQRTTRGLPGDAALLPPTGLKYGNPGLTGWGAANAAPQTAFAFWTMVLAKNPEDRDIFTNGVPDPRWLLNGMLVYQPRKDDTYPGGSGPQRRDDWRTWGWSENPYDHALAWVRGHYKLNTDGSIDKTRRIAGVGAPDSAIDFPAFVEGANVADANGWTISGEWSTSDGKWQTLVAMLQAGGGQPINRGAQISVLVNAPRVSTYTYTKADLVGQAQVKPLTPRRDRKNTIIPRYRSQANGWEYVAAGEVTDSTYRTEDRGEQRSTEVEYVHVRDARQAGQLAAYDLVTLREGLTATLPSKVHLLNVHAGDCITVNEPELAMVNQKFVVMRTTTDYKSAVVTLELRSETDAKHAFALGQTNQAPPSPALSAVDPRYIDPPVADDWTVVPQPPAGGTTQPIIIIIGKTEVGDAASIIVETGPSATGPWSTVYSGTPLLDGRYPSPGLQPGQQYWVSVRYVAKNGAISDRLIQGPITAGQLVAGDVSPNAPGLSDIYDQITLAFGDIFDVSELLGDARDLIDAQGVEIAAARGGQPSLNSRIVQVNQARIDGDTSNAEAISLVQARTANTEADIIDLENALATETAARVQSVSQLTARANANSPNLLKNPTGERGTSEWEGATTVGVIDGPSGKQFARFFGAGGNGDSFEFFTQNVAFDGSGQPFAWQSKVAVDGSVTAYCYALALNASGAQIGQIWGITVTTNPVDGRIEATGTTPAGTKSIRVHWALKASGPGYIIFWRQKLERGSVPGAWSDEATTQQLTASVTEQSLAIIDLENQQALASWNVVAAATGGKPARIGLTSSALGSFIALDAPFIFWGDNTVFDDATDTLQTTIGGYRRVFAFGAPFGASGNLLEWWGAESIALSAMTTTNGLNGRMTTPPYVFDTTIGSVLSATTNIRSSAKTRASPGSTSSDAVTVTAGGGSGTYAYQWGYFAGDASATCSAPTAATMALTLTVASGETKGTTWLCVITDTSTGKSTTVTFRYSLSQTS